MPNHISDSKNPAADPENMIAYMRDNPFAEAMGYVESLPESARARIAVFFYQRRHLRSTGLEIAKTCSRGALNEAAGGAGETIYHQSRNPDATMRAGQFTEERAPRHKKISLAGGQALAS